MPIFEEDKAWREVVCRAIECKPKCEVSEGRRKVVNMLDKMPSKCQVGKRRRKMIHGVIE